MPRYRITNRETKEHVEVEAPFAQVMSSDDDDYDDDEFDFDNADFEDFEEYFSVSTCPHQCFVELDGHCPHGYPSRAMAAGFV